MSTSEGTGQELTLHVTQDASVLHTLDCPHLSASGVAVLVPASQAQIAQLPMCASCQSILDGARRQRHSSLDGALEAFQAPLENRPRLREIAAGLEFTDIWIPASQSYIALAGPDGVVAYFAKGYADVYLSEGGYAREWLARHGSTGSSAPSVAVVAPAVCATCHTQLPATGVCDNCG